MKYSEYLEKLKKEEAEKKHNRLPTTLDMAVKIKPLKQSFFLKHILAFIVSAVVFIAAFTTIICNIHTISQFLFSVKSTPAYVKPKQQQVQQETTKHTHKAQAKNTVNNLIKPYVKQPLTEHIKDSLNADAIIRDRQLLDLARQIN